MSHLMYSDYAVRLESVISDVVITIQNVRASDDVDAGEAAKQLMASPHHWRVLSTAELL